MIWRWRPPEGESYGGAAHGGELRPEEVLCQVQHLLLRQHPAGGGELQHRHGRSVVGDHQRRGGAGRHLADGRLGNGRDLGGGGADIHRRLEEDLDDAHAVHRVAFGVLDIVDGGGEDALERPDDAVGHLAGREAGIVESDADHRHADIGKNVHRHAQRRHRPEDHDHQRHDDEGERTLQRDLDDPGHERRGSAAGRVGRDMRNSLGRRGALPGTYDRGLL